MKDPEKPRSVPLIPKLLAAFIIGLVLMIALVIFTEWTKDQPRPEPVPLGPGLELSPESQAP